MHDIIGIHPGDELPGAGRKAEIEGAHDPAPSAAYEFHPPIPLSRLLDHPGTSVRRPVIDTDELEIGVGLAEHALDAIGERRRGVVNGHQNRDCRTHRYDHAICGFIFKDPGAIPMRRGALSPSPSYSNRNRL